MDPCCMSFEVVVLSHHRTGYFYFHACLHILLLFFWCPLHMFLNTGRKNVNILTLCMPEVQLSLGVWLVYVLLTWPQFPFDQYESADLSTLCSILLDRGTSCIHCTLFGHTLSLSGRVLASQNTWLNSCPVVWLTQLTDLDWMPWNMVLPMIRSRSSWNTEQKIP